MPDIDCLFPRLKGAKIFSKLDMTQGFWHILLDEASSHLCTFITPYGQFRYLRMPFGILPAPEVFDRMVGDVVRGIPGAVHFVDDVLICGTTQAEHDDRLEIMLTRLQEAGFAINDKKCDICKREVLFLGHLVDGECVRPNPDKIRVLESFPRPSNVEEV